MDINNEEYRVVVAQKSNFETLLRAIKNDDVCLLECTLKATGEKVATICAMQSGADSTVSFIPFAIMLNGNPYEMLVPPNT